MSRERQGHAHRRGATWPRAAVLFALGATVLGAAAITRLDDILGWRAGEWGAVAAIAILGFAAWQILETRRATRATLRPWVLTDGVECDGILQKQPEPFHLTIRNFGQSPALEVLIAGRWRAQRRTQELGMRVTSRGADAFRVRHVLGPGQAARIPGDASMLRTTGGHPAQPNAWTVSGKITYRDQWGGTHVTRFRKVWRWRTKRFEFTRIGNSAE